MYPKILGSNHVEFQICFPYFHSIPKLKEVARKFNVLPERQAKVNYMIAAREKVEAAKVKVPILKSWNSAPIINYCIL